MWVLLMSGGTTTTTSTTRTRKRFFTLRGEVQPILVQILEEHVGSASTDPRREGHLSTSRVLPITCEVARAGITTTAAEESLKDGGPAGENRGVRRDALLS